MKHFGQTDLKMGKIKKKKTFPKIIKITVSNLRAKGYI